MKLLNHPIIMYVIISIVSLMIASILFYLGGSVAKIVEANEAIGLTMEAGGALAGFIIVFYYSKRAVIEFSNKLNLSSKGLPLKLFLKTENGPFIKTDEEYKCICVVLNQENGERKNIETKPFWEAGFLTIVLHEIETTHYISLKVTNEEKNWETDFISPMNRVIEFKS